MTFLISLARALPRLLAAFALICAFAGSSLAECAGRTLASDAVFQQPVCVPEAPKRIVALGSTYTLTMALELGLPVVGAPLFAVQDEKLLAMTTAAGVTDIGSNSEPSIERVIALQPDLILGDAASHAGIYELAKQIAPTVLIQAQDWKRFYATLAAATGVAGKADAGFADYERRAAAISERMPDITVSVLRITPFGFQVYVDGPASYAPFSVMRDAGVKRPDYETVTGDTILKRPDWEGLSQLTGDVLLYMVGNPYDDESGTTLEADTLSNPLWQTIPAVAAGRVHKLDVTTWMGFGGLGSAHRVLDDIERYILGQP